jgi:TolB-like protein/DNA-binding winged helix-turn-helix (wHTH) protein
MAAEPEPARVFRFGSFEADLGNRQLFRNGISVSLTGQPFEVLTLLLERPGQLVTREQLRARLWPSGTVVEFDRGITAALTKLREVLHDDAQHPRFIATVPRHGYRFISPVSTAAQAALEPSTRAVPESAPQLASTATSDVVPSAVQGSWWSRRTVPAILAAVLVLIGGTAAYVYLPRAGQRAAGVSPAIYSLAVLPLENLSGDKEQEYFADGMTDALTTDLAQIGSLRVISRTSAMHFKGSKETLPQIGRDLKVDAVVEGTVTRGENRVRVTAQLVEASSDHHLWARSYERDLKNVLALQDEIAHDITEQIRVKLNPKAPSLVSQVHAVDPEAYDAYLRGSYWLSQATLEGYKKGCDYIQKAIAKDPSYAPAYVGVAQCSDSPDKFREAIAKALVLDPSLAEAHSSLATMKFAVDWDWSGAEAEHKQAIALNPNSAPAHHWYSFELVAMGRLDEAMREIELARDLDPYSAAIADWLGQVLYHARRYDEALRENRRGLEMHPDALGFYWEIADVYEQKKMFAEAFAARQQALSLAKDPRVTAQEAGTFATKVQIPRYTSEGIRNLGEAYKRSGYKGYLLKQAEFEESHRPAYAAHIYALLNDEPRAMAALEAAYNKHIVGILFMRTAPELDSIRSSPHYRELVRRIGFPQPPSDKN